MTFIELCRHLQARRVGKGKYMAKCPAHDDSRPSLSIREGDKTALVRCMSSGCSLEEIVKASGIRKGDLYYEQPARRPSRAALRAKEAAAAVDDVVRECRRTILYRREQWARVAMALGYLLSRNPDNKTLAEAHWYALCCSGGELPKWRQQEATYSPFPSQKLLHGITSHQVTPQIARLLKLPA